MAVYRQYAQFDFFSNLNSDDVLYTSRTPTGFSGVGENLRLDVTGAGLTYDSAGEPIAGTVTGFKVYQNNTLIFTIGALSLPVAPFIAGEFDYTAGNDVFYGGNTLNDGFSMGAGDDKGYGYGGNDDISGDSGNDTIDGGIGNDDLSGDSGNDTLIGGLNNDNLAGGLGKDTLNGGAGADNFHFNSIRESLKGVTRDVIQDFTPSQGDKIDLTFIDANGVALGDAAFVFTAVKGVAFNGTKGQLRWYWSDVAVAANDRTIVEADVNGDRVADFQIELVGLKSLVAGDFVL